MKPLTDTEKAFTYLNSVERDIRKFLQDSDGIHAPEYFEDVHIALVEAMELLGVDAADAWSDDDALIAEGDEMEHAAELENFDPITHIEAQEKTGELK